MYISRRSYPLKECKYQCADYYRMRGPKRALTMVRDDLQEEVPKFDGGSKDQIELKVVSGEQCMEYETRIPISVNLSIFMLSADVTDMGPYHMLEIYVAYYANEEEGPGSPDAFARTMYGFAATCGFEFGCESCRYRANKRDSDGLLNISDTTCLCHDPLDLFEGRNKVYLDMLFTESIGVGGYYKDADEIRAALLRHRPDLRKAENAERLELILSTSIRPVRQLVL